MISIIGEFVQVPEWMIEICASKQAHVIAACPCNTQTVIFLEPGAEVVVVLKPGYRALKQQLLAKRVYSSLLASGLSFSSPLRSAPLPSPEFSLFLVSQPLTSRCLCSRVSRCHECHDRTRPGVAAQPNHLPSEHPFWKSFYYKKYKERV